MIIVDESVRHHVRVCNKCVDLFLFWTCAAPGCRLAQGEVVDIFKYYVHVSYNTNGIKPEKNAAHA